jgi:O-antigen/teichoic acid export membrane protein
MNKAERFDRLVGTDAIRKDLRCRSVRGAGFTWAAGIADFVLRIGSTAILARLILPQQFGLVMMVTAITAVADQFRDLGLSTVTIQRKTINHQQVTNLFWMNVFAGIAIALMVAAASPLVSAYYKEPSLTLITCILATNFIWGGLVVQHEALLGRTLKLGHTAAVRVLASVISVVVAVLLRLLGAGLEGGCSLGAAYGWNVGLHALDPRIASPNRRHTGHGPFRRALEWRQHFG